MNGQYSFPLDEYTHRPSSAERKVEPMKPSAEQTKPSALVNQPKERLTEIILPNLPIADDLLMPIVAKLSQPGQKWLTWVSTEIPCKKRLLANGVNLAHLRIVLIDRHIHYQVIEALLALGNSHTVIAEVDELTDIERFEMEQAAALGNTNAIMVTQKSR